ncbi:MAG: hypothetical protein F6K28_39435 [Microcoleus sp. SIO2G3]|nr:hypothetical protein [Microcoleus sp. SIO2G3]
MPSPELPSDALKEVDKTAASQIQAHPLEMFSSCTPADGQVTVSLTSSDRTNRESW